MGGEGDRESENVRARERIREKTDKEAGYKIQEEKERENT